MTRRGHRPPWVLGTLFLIVMLGVAAACGGDEDESASGELRVHDVGVTTGVGVVDEVAAAVAHGDIETLVGLVAYQSVDCVAPPREYGGRPTCDAGTADGTQVQRFPVAIGELAWTADARTFLEQLVEASEGLWPWWTGEESLAKSQTVRRRETTASSFSSRRTARLSASTL